MGQRSEAPEVTSQVARGRPDGWRSGSDLDRFIPQHSYGHLILGLPFHFFRTAVVARPIGSLPGPAAAVCGIQH